MIFSAGRGRVLPFFGLAVSLLVFYGPMLLSARTVVTTTEDDPAENMVTSLGDHRPGGRFFHYFDLSSDTRLWGQDVVFHPFHLLRRASIALGAGLAGWGVLLMGLHSLLFFVVYRYSRTIFRVARAAGVAGAAVAFFSLSWSEWILRPTWAPAAILLAVSLGEYGLFLKTAKRGHLLACAVANTLQPYVAGSSALIPTQIYLFGAIVLMAFYDRQKHWGKALSPWILFVWPLTALGWVPILAPMLFSLGSGLVARYSPRELAWGLDGSVFTGLGGLLCPAPIVLGDLLGKLGWLGKIQAPDNFLFGSFLFLPSALALWRSGERALRTLATGTALYIASLAAAELIRTPFPVAGGLGFSRSFLFPLVSGFVVAAGIGREEFGRPSRVLHRIYHLLLAGAAAIFLLLCALNAEQLTRWASRWGILGSGMMIPQFLRGTRAVAAGIALGLAGYFGVRVFRASSRPVFCAVAFCLAVAAPTWGVGYAQDWHVRNPGLDAALSPPSEFRFLRDRVPSYEYRVGLILASNVHLAQGDRRGFWATILQRENVALSYLSADDKSLRQGLAFLLPSLHFYTPVQRKLWEDGNPFLRGPAGPEGAFLNRRRAEIVDPGPDSFEAYGVRYWLSNFDLRNLYPGKFSRVYQGEYAAVFENKSAKPVAFFLEEPGVPLPLEHIPWGIAVRLPDPKGGRLSLQVDLRNMKANAVNPSGRAVPLALQLQPSAARWEADVPPGSSAVLLTAAEAVPLQMLTAGSGITFALFLALAALRGIP